MDNFLSTEDVAQRFGVTAATVRRWVAEKSLIPALRTPGGRYRFDTAGIAAFISTDSATDADSA